MDRIRLCIGLLIVICCYLISGDAVQGQTIMPGAESMEEYLPRLGKKRVAVVANNASVVGPNRVNIVDTLLARGVRITKVFSPEHGFRTFGDAGQLIADSADKQTGLPVISLYGKKKRPGADDLKEVDIVLFDLQDVGVRFFTYISTLTGVMESCAISGIPVIVLDRPNPNGFYIDGPVLEPQFTSFVGLHPVPVVYGMTIGEYALMVNGEGWLEGGKRCTVEVIRVQGYAHYMMYALPVKPSPNLTTMNAVYLYPSLCLFEGTDVSIGRGTAFPFEAFAHPHLKGFEFSFTPRSIPGMSLNPPHLGVLCRGVDLREFYATRSKMLGRINLSWLLMAYRGLDNPKTFFNDYFDKLAGTASLRKGVMDGLTEQQIKSGWQEGIEKFRLTRSKYLIYPD